MPSDLSYTATPDRFRAEAVLADRLRAALDLPRRNRAVAEWLYGAYHDRGSPILHPQAFKRSSGLYSSHTHLNVQLPTEPVQPPPAPSVLRVTATYALFVPSTTADGITMGYSFHLEVPRNNRSPVLRHIFPDTRMHRGRYVYCEDTEELYVLFSISACTLSLCYSESRVTGFRQYSYFVIPRQEYTFEAHPSRVLAMGCMEGTFCLPSMSKCSTHAQPNPHPSLPRRPAAAARTQRKRAAADDPDPEPLSRLTVPNGPSDYVNGVWREDNISNLPPCMFQDLDASGAASEKHVSDFDGAGPAWRDAYRKSASWLQAHQVRELTRPATAKQAAAKKRPVLFDMRSVGGSARSGARAPGRCAASRAPMEGEYDYAHMREQVAGSDPFGYEGGTDGSPAFSVAVAARSGGGGGGCAAEEAPRLPDATAAWQGIFSSAQGMQGSFDARTGRMTHAEPLALRIEASMPPPSVHGFLRQMASQVYYSAVLWVSTDDELVAAQEEKAALSMITFDAGT